MKTTTRVIKGYQSWYLRFECEEQDNIIFTKTFEFLKLIEVIDAANLLKVHIDNMNELPLRQYETFA
jgi:hypothetical protein